MSKQNALVVGTLMFTLCGDAEVQAAGPCIADTQLQAIVEKTIQKFYPLPPPPELAHHDYPLANERPPKVN